MGRAADRAVLAFRHVPTLEGEEKDIDEEQEQALRTALGLDGHYVVTCEVNEEHLDTPDSGALYVLLVEGERVILVSHGWGASGAHVDVRCYVGLEQPQQVEPVVIDAGGTVMVVNPVTDTRPV